MQLWQDLVRIALIGTARQSPSLPLETAAPKLKSLLAQFETDDAEATLLRAAALLTLWRRAGYRPGQVEGEINPLAPAESQPCCSTQATAYLIRMLNGYYSELLAEWLEAVAAQGQRVPEESLPALLELGQQKPALRKF